MSKITIKKFELTAICEVADELECRAGAYLREAEQYMVEMKREVDEFNIADVENDYRYSYYQESLSKWEGYKNAYERIFALIE